MSATMDAASGATADRMQRIKEEEKKSWFGDVVNLGLGNDWPAPDLGDEFRAPLTTDVRTLFLSGTLDFNTPPYQAEEVRWGFSNSSHIIVDYAGHEQILRHPQAGATIIRFLKGENVDDVALFYPKLRFIPVTGDSNNLSHGSLSQTKERSSRKAIAATPSQLDRFLGTYDFGKGKLLTISRKGQNLYSEMKGYPTMKLYVENESTIFYRDHNAWFEFEFEAQENRPSKVTFVENGQTFHPKIMK